MKLQIVLVGMVLFSILLIPITQAHTANTSIEGINYHKYSSLLAVDYHNTSVISLNNEIYTVNNETYIGNSSHVQINGYHSTYLISILNLTQTSGTVNVTSYANGSLVVYSSIPYLARILVMSGDMEELAWAGLTTSSATISTSAYINGSGYIVLQYLNGTAFTNVTLNVKTSTTVSKQITLNLYQVSASLSSVTQYTAVLNVQVPRKYTPLTQSLYANGSNISANSNGYVVGYAYFNGVLLPSIEWKGLGLGRVHMPGIGSGINMYANFTTLEFYGTNGTAVGYVHSSYAHAYGNLSLSLLLVKEIKEIDYVAGEVMIVHVSNNYQYPQSAPITVHHNGSLIIVILANSSVETTANVTIYHEVAVNSTHGRLLQLAINSTLFYIVIVNNNAYNATTATPKVNETHVTISGNSYLAQEVQVNASQYTVFNVTALANTFTVFKVVNGQYIQLNSSNYFEINGKIIVFDDPSNTYVIVYNYAPSSSSSSTSPSTSSASSTSSMTSSSLASSSSSSSSSATSSSTQNYALIAIIIVVIIIIIAAVFLLRRR